jgi:cytoskeletal protein CcmA (bactofilin family)
VRAGEFIELQAKARVTGDVSYKMLEMHIGAVVEGRLIYINEPTPPLAASED